MPDDDLQLLQRWRDGDRAAGEALFGRHFGEIYRFFEHKVGHHADDLTQRTFLACVRARDQFRGASSFRTYLFTIARHELYALVRQLAGSQPFDCEVSSIADAVTSLATRMARADDAERLRRALKELPAEQQVLLELHYWHELDANALAEVFETNSGAIRVRLLRARRALKDRLRPEELPIGDKFSSALQDLDFSDPET